MEVFKRVVYNAFVVDYAFPQMYSLRCIRRTRYSCCVQCIRRPSCVPSHVQIESGPLRAVHLSRHKWPGGVVNKNSGRLIESTICCPLTDRSRTSGETRRGRRQAPRPRAHRPANRCPPTAHNLHDIPRFIFHIPSAKFPV